MIRPTLACALQSCIGQQWGNDDFNDFCLVVEDKSYRCHRFILRACSRFFDGLFRSDMMETRKACTMLPGITSDIFDIILNFVYRGIDGLTQENVVSVWKVVHQLQIDYLIKECEDFVMAIMSVDNCVEYYDCANLLQSEKVVKFSFEFMLNKFYHFRDTEAFLDLTADELYMMVESHNLNIASEELVIESILRWVSRLSPCSEVLHKDVDDKTYDSLQGENPSDNTEGTVTTGNQQAHVTRDSGGDNVDILDVLPILDMLSIDENVDKDGDRVKDLGRLLSVARVCLLRPDYLQTLKEHPIICTNLEATNVLSNAALYQQSFQHDYWPHSAVHRSCSDMTHVMVFVDDFTIECKFYSLENGSTHILCPLFFLRDYYYERTQFTLAVSDQSLFLGESYENDVYEWESNIYHWEKSSGWNVSVPSIDKRIEKFLSIDQQTYIIATNSVSALDNGDVQLGNILLNDVSMTFPNCINGAFKYKESILLIAEVRENKEEVDGDLVGTVEEDEDDVADDLMDIVPVLECYNSTTKERSRLKYLECPCSSTISFCCGDNVYTLQGDGILCLVISVKDKDDNGQSRDDKVLFQFIAKLWDFWMRPNGAVVYKNELFIFGRRTDNSKTWMTSVPALSDFKTIKIVHIDSTSKCHPMTVPRSWIKLNPVLKNVPRSWYY